jgi:sentrin-specific protease 1
MLRKRSLLLSGWAHTEEEACAMTAAVPPSSSYSSSSSSLSIIGAKDDQIWKPNPCYFYKSFLYSKLIENGVYDYSRVKEWTMKGRAKADIFQHSRIFFPINHNNIHWSLAYVDVDKQSITYLDSLGCDGKDVLKNILHYLKDEHLDKKQNPLPNAWTLLSPDVPQQTNGNDCGVFVCAFAFHLSIGMSVIGIRQSDMDKWRNKILDDIIHF